MNNTLVRRATSKDIDRIVEIWKARNRLQGIDLAQAEDPSSLFESLLTKQDERFGFWVLEDAGRVVGWQGLLPCCPSPLEWRYWAFSSVYLEKRCRVPEAGTKIMTAALEEAGRAGLAQVFAYISPTNSLSIRLAKRVGWTFCAKIPPRFRGPMTSELELYTYTFANNPSENNTRVQTVAVPVVQ